MTATIFPSAHAGPAARTAAPAPTLPLLAGVGAVFLALHVLALALAAAGHPVPGAAAALDPARGGSLTSAWASAQLGLAAAAALLAARAGRPGAGLAAALALALALADGLDLPARLADLLRGPALPALPAKVLASGAVAAPILALAVALAVRGAAPGRLGRRLTVTLLAGCGLSVALDLLGTALDAPAPARALASAEEPIELLLYAVVAARIVDHALGTANVANRD